MNHLGEIISLGVAVSWTITAWFADKASRRVGAMVTNVLRLVLATLFLGALLWVTIGLIPDILVNKKKIRLKEIIGLAVSITGVALFFLL